MGDKIIIIPCYNEYSRIDEGYFSSFNSNGYSKVLFVNDGSTDNTLQVLKQLCDKNENLAFIDLKQNEGKAEAIRKGFNYINENLNADYIAFADCDLATDLYELNVMFKILEEGKYDFVFGSRWKRIGSQINRKRYRHLMGRVFATFVSIILKLPVYDTQCGAKVFNSSKTKYLFKNEFISNWFFDVELFARMRNQNSIEYVLNNTFEYPLKKWEDKDGSKIKTTDFFKAPLELLRINKAYN